MAIFKAKPTSPGRRFRVQIKQDLHKGRPEKSLTESKRRTSGRNNNGHITTRHKGGGHKRLYRIIDFKRGKQDVEAIVQRIEYDPNRSANIALMSNLILVTAIMSAVGATLTLPGIAGIVLTVGMAVDANVLIFARISEELKAHIDPQNAIKNGFSKAFSTIMDANITTLLVALILYAIGTGPIKGFAVTLSIGIVTSIFTAILVTRSLVNFIYGYRRVEELKV